ncbi:protein shortage in chiasmata 1 ortholog [Tachyglossus aculeatus]|uniref:protein shortage in chiasmata 1 ortholog n=1 Tax=Tachyglossus aculeatus TaxID=9261 RepID=UPI0018F75C9A|nr:protein shortage in chiasmata 1 ortholog [Tachyglossus aculeatus]
MPFYITVRVTGTVKKTPQKVLNRTKLASSEKNRTFRAGPDTDAIALKCFGSASTWCNTLLNTDGNHRAEATTSKVDTLTGEEITVQFNNNDRQLSVFWGLPPRPALREPDENYKNSMLSAPKEDNNFSPVERLAEESSQHPGGRTVFTSLHWLCAFPSVIHVSHYKILKDRSAVNEKSPPSTQTPLSKLPSEDPLPENNDLSSCRNTLTGAPQEKPDSAHEVGKKKEKIFPSSNPSPSIDVRGMDLPDQNIKQECSKVRPTPYPGLFIDEEMIFKSNMAGYQKWLPFMKTFLIQIQGYVMMDPAPESQQNHFREPVAFPSIPEVCENKVESDTFKERFCGQPQKEPSILPTTSKSTKAADLKQADTLSASEFKVPEKISRIVRNKERNKTGQRGREKNTAKEVNRLKENQEKGLENRSLGIKQTHPAHANEPPKNINYPKKLESTVIYVEIKASASQCDAYALLEASATPLMRELTDLAVLSEENGNFATVTFDQVRVFLQLQEKKVNANLQQNRQDEKEKMLLKLVALLNFLVTVRDILLICNLYSALEYISTIKSAFKRVLGSPLEDICRKLEIVQFIKKKKPEANHKIKELELQLLKWIRSINTQNKFKVLIISRLKSQDETYVLYNCLRGIGLSVLVWATESTFLELNLLDCLRKCSCLLVCSTHIGNDFPWTHFSFVIEYNYSEKFNFSELCRCLKINYMAFRCTLPDSILQKSVTLNVFSGFLLEIQVPYVFLFMKSKGWNTVPEVLRVLEANYDITLWERPCSEALQCLETPDRYVLVTVDVDTAIILQDMEELNCPGAPDNIMLKVIALSVQYTNFWIIFYPKEKQHSGFCLSENILRHLAVLHASLVSPWMKTEEVEVKLVLVPEAKEAATLTRQIADQILTTSSRSVFEFLDKSWLSPSLSKEEEFLLSFPCVNPLVAQMMLYQAPSLYRLVKASLRQLEQLLPEVPPKVLQLFKAITSTYNFAPLHLAGSPYLPASRGRDLG